MLNFSYKDRQALLTVMHRTTNGSSSATGPVFLDDCLSASASRVNIRAFVDPAAGTMDVYFDGRHIPQIGHFKDQRMPGLAGTITLQARDRKGSPMMLSEIRVARWDGSPPGRIGETPRVLLANGDSASGSVKGMHDGSFSLETEIGLLEIPMAQAQLIEFGGVCTSEATAARVRLQDGGIIHLDNLHADGTGISGHSPIFGDLRLPGSLVSELILDPAALPSPMPAAEKDLKQVTDKASAASPRPSF